MNSPNVISEFFMWLGPYKWPMTIIFFVVVGLIICKFIDLYFLAGKQPGKKGNYLNAIIFWGSFQFFFGIFVQTSGLWAALNEIIHAADVSPVIMITGFLGSFVSVLFGSATLLIAALGWWGLRARYQSMVKLGAEH